MDTTLQNALQRLMLVLVVCVLTESRDALSAQRSGENEVGCIRGERNGFVLILYPRGTGLCWYCIREERVSVGIISAGNGFLLVLYPWGTGFC